MGQFTIVSRVPVTAIVTRMCVTRVTEPHDRITNHHLPPPRSPASTALHKSIDQQLCMRASIDSFDLHLFALSANRFVTLNSSQVECTVESTL